MRNDVHRPSVINPAEYVAVLDFARPKMDQFEPGHNHQEANNLYLERGEKINGGVYNCDICGARYDYGTLFEYIPSGKIISVGHECAEKMDLHADMIGSARDLSKMQGMRAREKYIRMLSLVQFARENREKLHLLKLNNPISKDIRERLISSGARWGVSDKQWELLRNIEKRIKEQESEIKATVPDFPDRMEFVGVIVGTKVVETMYGMQTKMIVKINCENGAYKIYGSVPSGLTNEICNFKRENGIERDGIRGAHISFFATVQRSKDDSSFGFFNRPTKPKFLNKMD